MCAFDTESEFKMSCFYCDSPHATLSPFVIDFRLGALSSKFFLLYSKNSSNASFLYLLTVMLLIYLSFGIVALEFWKGVQNNFISRLILYILKNFIQLIKFKTENDAGNVFDALYRIERAWTSDGNPVSLWVIQHVFWWTLTVWIQCDGAKC